MSINKKLLLAFLISFAILLPSLAHCDTVLKVGVVAPLTGPIGIVGESMRNAITLENEKAAANPASLKLEFIFEDDQFDPKTAVSAVRKLIDVDKVKALLVFGSASTFASSGLAEQAGVPMVALAFSEKVVENKSFIFRMFQTARQQAELLAKEIERRKYSSIAIVTATNEANIVMRDSLKVINKVKVVAEEEVAPNDFDLKVTALKIVQAKPAAVALFLIGPQLGVLPRRLRELGYKGDIFGSSPMQNQAQINAASGALEGAWLSALDMSHAQNFLAEYQKRFSTPVTPDGILAYDAAALIRQAAASGDIAKAIKAMPSFDGIFGRHQKLADNSFDSPLVIKKVENGQVVVAK